MTDLTNDIKKLFKKCCTIDDETGKFTFDNLSMADGMEKLLEEYPCLLVTYSNKNCKNNTRFEIVKYDKYDNHINCLSEPDNSKLSIIITHRNLQNFSAYHVTEILKFYHEELDSLNNYPDIIPLYAFSYEDFINPNAIMEFKDLDELMLYAKLNNIKLSSFNNDGE
jgi:hypothetical protein